MEIGCFQNGTYRLLPASTPNPEHWSQRQINLSSPLLQLSLPIPTFFQIPNFHRAFPLWPLCPKMAPGVLLLLSRNLVPILDLAFSEKEEK